jgi:SAM-dependent methyltransferase
MGSAVCYSELAMMHQTPAKTDDKARIDFDCQKIDEWLMSQFVCPVDHVPLERKGNWLINLVDDRKRYPIVNNVPVFIPHHRENTSWWGDYSRRLAARVADGVESYNVGAWTGQGVHPHVQSIIDSTGGYLYRSCRGVLREYPIPGLPMEPHRPSVLLLDIGCNWGRWTFAAAKKGFAGIGIDPSLDAVMAARDIRKQLGLPCYFFVGDARFLPFRDGFFDAVFSYSVIQHFSKANANITIAEIARVLALGGEGMIQMPNCYRVRSFYHLLKRGFSLGRDFDVRYYTPKELRKTFESHFGNAKFEVDGFFGLGIQADDIDIMAPHHRIIVKASEVLRHLAARIMPLTYLADSLYVISLKKS